VKLREKSIIVLEALFQGQEIELEITPKIKHRITMDNDELKIIALQVSKDSQEEVLLGCQLEVNEFIKICNKLSDEEISIIAANIALNKSRKVKR